MIEFYLQSLTFPLQPVSAASGMRQRNTIARGINHAKKIQRISQ